MGKILSPQINKIGKALTLAIGNFKKNEDMKREKNFSVLRMHNMNSFLWLVT